jgi:hypothetical protein
MPQQYVANLYPAVVQSGATQPVLGICLSGGGSRALSCALGQLSALNGMTMPDGSPILGPAQYISSVSGGSWASVLYTFLPLTINQTPVSDADFLIQPVAPGSLKQGEPSDPSQGNVSYMGPYCMGLVPQRFSMANIGVFLKTLMDAEFFSNSSQWGWFWIAGIGEIVLKPFELYSATYNASGPFVQPSLMFSLSTGEVDSIAQYNPSLGPGDFYLARTGRPSLIVNTNLLEDYQLPSSPQVPVQATPVATSVPGQSMSGMVTGGGGVESFGFTSTLIGPGGHSGTASISTNRTYSLCDIAGCSSAFFASLLLQYIDDGVQDIVSDLVDYLINDLGWNRFVAEAVGFALTIALETFTSDAGDVIPQYNYWPEAEVRTPPPNKTLGFSDGGDFDNTGILGLLAQTDANRIIAFVNTETALKGTSTDLTLDISIGLLFGYEGAGTGNLVGVQVFDDSNPLYPNGAFAAVQAGLYNASCGGGTSLGKSPAFFLQKGLVTIQNTVANIAEGRVVDVLWVYNNPVSDWQDAITDPGIVADLKQVSQEGTALWNFPNYDTGEQVYLGVEAVNMLAQLSAWNVQQISGTIAEWLGA